MTNISMPGNDDSKNTIKDVTAQNSLLIQGTTNSVIIVNQNREPVAFPKGLVPIGNDIPLHYKQRNEESIIFEHFAKGNKTLVLLNGEGGIGKTTLAAKYLNDNLAHYKHYAWLNAQFNITDTMLDLYFRLGLKKDEIPADKQIQYLCFALNSLNTENNCLLILDNANNEAQLRDFKKHFGALNWQILITSRCNELGFDTAFTTIRIDHLPTEMAKELFCDYYTENSADFTNQLEQFLQNVANNTLLITLFAKYMNRCNEARKGKYTLAELNTDFKRKNFFIADDKKPVKHQLDSKSVNLFLTELYRLSELTQNEGETLFLFAFLPLKYVDFEHLHIFLQNSISENELEGTLGNLHVSGWLQKKGTDKGLAFKINSPVIQNFLIEHYKENVWDKIFIYVSLLTNLLKIDFIKDNPIDKFQWTTYGNVVLENLGSYDFLKPILYKPEIASLGNNLATVYQDLGNIEKACTLLEMALESNLANFGNKHPYVAVSQSNLASVYRDLGDLEKAKNLLDKALQSDLENFGETNSRVALCQNNLALVYKDLGDYEKARVLLEKAIQSDLANFGEKHPNVANRMANLAEVYKRMGDLEQAQNLMEKAFQSDLENFGEMHPSVVPGLNTLASVYKELGDFGLARDLLEKALLIELENFGENHPGVATCQNNLALMYRDLGELEKAQDLLEKALESGLENFGENHPEVAIRQSNLAVVYRDLGDLEKAKGLLEKALQYNMENFGENHPEVAIHQSNLAVVFQDLGDFEKARDLYEKAILSDLENFGENHPSIAISQSNLATLYRDLGEIEKALDLLKKALQSDLENLGEKHPNVAIRQSNLASVYIDLQQKAKALELWQSAYSIMLIALGADHPETKSIESFINKYSS